MISQLIESLSDKFWLISPFVVLNEYERGVLLRWGLYHREIPPGPCWKWPVMDQVLTTECIQQTLTTQSQTLTTQDGVSVTLSAVIQYEISDVRRYLLDVYEGEDAISDNVIAAVEYHVGRSYYDDLSGTGLRGKVLSRVRRRVREYGVTIKWLAFADKTKTIPLRLMTD